MTFMRPLALLASVLAYSSGCRQTPEAIASQLRRVEAVRQKQVAQRIVAAASSKKEQPVAEWIVPPELREISGLALEPNGFVLAHDDEVARIYEIDPKTGIILKRFTLAGLPHGDFEAIAMAGSDIYLLESNGKLYKFKQGPDASEVAYSTYDTRLGHECEFESLVFEADSSRLVLPCKKAKGKDVKHELVIYRVPLPLTDSSAFSKLTIPMDEVIGGNKWKTFRPSDVTIDPETGNYVMLGSIEKAIATVTPDGEVVSSRPLPKGHNQAEGVAITRDSLLIVSDEATHTPATITLYRWRR